MQTWIPVLHSFNDIHFFLPDKGVAGTGSQDTLSSKHICLCLTSLLQEIPLVSMELLA